MKETQGNQTYSKGALARKVHKEDMTRTHRGFCLLCSGEGPNTE